MEPSTPEPTQHKANTLAQLSLEEVTGAPPNYLITFDGYEKVIPRTAHKAKEFKGTGRNIHELTNNYSEVFGQPSPKEIKTVGALFKKESAMFLRKSNEIVPSFSDKETEGRRKKKGPRPSSRLQKLGRTRTIVRKSRAKQRPDLALVKADTEIVLRHEKSEQIVEALLLKRLDCEKQSKQATKRLLLAEEYTDKTNLVASVKTFEGFKLIKLGRRVKDSAIPLLLGLSGNTNAFRITNATAWSNIEKEARKALAVERIPFALPPSNGRSADELQISILAAAKQGYSFEEIDDTLSKSEDIAYVHAYLKGKFYEQVKYYLTWHK